MKISKESIISGLERAKESSRSYKNTEHVSIIDNQDYFKRFSLEEFDDWNRYMFSIDFNNHDTLDSFCYIRGPIEKSYSSRGCINGNATFLQVNYVNDIEVIMNVDAFKKFVQYNCDPRLMIYNGEIHDRDIVPDINIRESQVKRKTFDNIKFIPMRFNYNMAEMLNTTNPPCMSMNHNDYVELLNDYTFINLTDVQFIQCKKVLLQNPVYDDFGNIIKSAVIEAYVVKLRTYGDAQLMYPVVKIKSTTDLKEASIVMPKEEVEKHRIKIENTNIENDYDKEMLI